MALAFVGTQFVSFYMKCRLIVPQFLSNVHSERGVSQIHVGCGRFFHIFDWSLVQKVLKQQTAVLQLSQSSIVQLNPLTASLLSIMAAKRSSSD